MLPQGTSRESPDCKVISLSLNQPEMFLLRVMSFGETHNQQERSTLVDEETCCRSHILLVFFVLISLTTNLFLQRGIFIDFEYFFSKIKLNKFLKSGDPITPPCHTSPLR